MYKSTIIALLGVTLAVAQPMTHEKRDPSDKSGKATIAFACDNTIIPNPGGPGGEGEGGTGLFTTSLVFTDEGGVQHHPDACTAIDNFCNNCIVSGGGLSSPTNITGCSNPAGGACSIQFQYNGYGYNSETKEPKCGHQNSFQAFGDTKTAICYFNV